MCDEDDKLEPATETAKHKVRTGYIALGSNMPSFAGDPAATLLAAIRALSAYVRVLGHSSFYSTRPVGFSQQPNFVNAVVRVRTGMSPANLMRRLLQIEREFGRHRSELVAKGPRTLDLDLLLLEDVVLTTPLLTLPHPVMAERRFVLAPLAELAPELLHPVIGKKILDLLKTLPVKGENGVDAVRILRLPKE
jgi:2-amino-4-hydroxy-6-hydroxymethyldihydropteridine diphosphokinase